MLSFLKLNINLTGGRGTYWAILGGMPLAAALLAYLTFSAIESPNYGSICSVWLIVVTGVQALVLLLGAPGALRKSIERDFTTGMIDSHRILPRSNLALAFNYSVMTPVQMLTMYVALVPVGIAFSVAIDRIYNLGGLALIGWLFLQLNLLTMAAMLSTLVTSMTLAGEGKTAIIGFIIMASLFGGIFLVLLVPGLSILSGLINLSLLTNLIGNRSIAPNPVYLFSSILSQSCFALIFFFAASRRVRVNVWPMYSVGLGLILFLALALVLGVGFLVAGADPGSTPFSRDNAAGHIQLVATMAVLGFCAFVPLSSAISEARVILQSGRRVRVAFLHHPLVIISLVTLISLIVPLGYRLSEDQAALSETMAGLMNNVNLSLILLTLAVTAVVDYTYLAVGMRLRISPWFVAIFLLILFRVGPVLVEAFLHSLTVDDALPRFPTPPPGLIGGLSPLGLISNLVRNEGHIVSGFVAQGALMLVMIAAASYYRIRKNPSA